MYKLLLVTNRDEVREAFSQVEGLNRLMFDPVIIVNTVEEAKACLKTQGADAVSFDLPKQEHEAMWAFLREKHPHLPVFNTKNQGEALRHDLAALRDYLDAVHADYSDSDSNEGLVVNRLQNDLVHRLLEGRVKTAAELVSRMELTRAPFRHDSPLFLFEFDLPEGQHYLNFRWHHGFARLDLSLRSNFFGRIPGRMYYGAALVSPERLRVIACPTEDLSEDELDQMSAQVQSDVLNTAEQVKNYMDLELVCTRFTVIKGLEKLIQGGEAALDPTL